MLCYGAVYSSLQQSTGGKVGTAGEPTLFVQKFEFFYTGSVDVYCGLP
jgi:hypothetical protein